MTITKKGQKLYKMKHSPNVKNTTLLEKNRPDYTEQ